MHLVYNGAILKMISSTNVKRGNMISKYDLLNNLVETNNGYLFSEEAQKASVSRTTIADYVRRNNMEKVAKGIYVSEDTFPDELFILQKCYPAVVFSGETALYLQGMIDREYNDICVTVPTGFSGSRLRERGVVIHSMQEDAYNMGITTVATDYGNSVRCYDKELVICDTVKNRNSIEIQNYQSAVRTYMRDKDKDLSKLILYARKLRVADEIMRYVEVLV